MSGGTRDGPTPPLTTLLIDARRPAPALSPTQAPVWMLHSRVSSRKENSFGLGPEERAR